MNKIQLTLVVLLVALVLRVADQVWFINQGNHISISAWSKVINWTNPNYPLIRINYVEVPGKPGFKVSIMDYSGIFLSTETYLFDRDATVEKTVSIPEFSKKKTTHGFSTAETTVSMSGLIKENNNKFNFIAGAIIASKKQIDSERVL